MRFELTTLHHYDHLLTTIRPRRMKTTLFFEFCFGFVFSTVTTFFSRVFKKIFFISKISFLTFICIKFEIKIFYAFFFKIFFYAFFQNIFLRVFQNVFLRVLYLMLSNFHRNLQQHNYKLLNNINCK